MQYNATQFNTVDKFARKKKLWLWSMLKRLSIFQKNVVLYRMVILKYYCPSSATGYNFSSMVIGKNIKFSQS